MARKKKSSGKKWIQKAVKHPGALRKTLGVKSGEKIPYDKLVAASHAPGVEGARARLAITLRKMH